MPLYDFQCETCSAVFEVQRALGATGRVRCTACGSLRTTKIFSAAGIVFKGTGFHVTDYKSPDGRSEARDSDGAAKPPSDEGSGSAPGPKSSDKGSGSGNAKKSDKTT